MNVYKRTSNTHVHHKSEFEAMVDYLLQFDSTKSINVKAIPLLISEGTVKFDDFIYKFYKWFQFRFGKAPIENDIDDRLDVHQGICYTLDYTVVPQEPLMLTDGTQFVKHCNQFLDDWLTNLIHFSKSNPALGYADAPEYWAMKVTLKNGQVGWMYPKQLLLPTEDGKHQALFHFKPVS